MFPNLLLYIGIAVIAVIDLIWLSLSHIHIQYDAAIQVILPIILIGILAIAGRYLKRYLNLLPVKTRAEGLIYIERMILIFDGLLFIRLTWLSLSVFNFVSMSSGFPDADAFLAQADRSLHLNWTYYFNFMTQNSIIVDILVIFYFLLTPLSILVFLYLIVFNYKKRAEYFIATYFVTAIICLTIGMFFPAEGAISYILENKVPKETYHYIYGNYHIDYINKLRSGTPIGLNLKVMPGLVTFPSFHTAAGIVLAGSLYGTPFFGIMALYATIMIASTPVIGSHYFIDLIAGAAIAFFVLAAFKYISRYKALKAST